MNKAPLDVGTDVWGQVCGMTTRPRTLDKSIPTASLSVLEVHLLPAHSTHPSPAHSSPTHLSPTHSSPTTTTYFQAWAASSANALERSKSKIYPLWIFIPHPPILHSLIPHPPIPPGRRAGGTPCPLLHPWPPGPARPSLPQAGSPPQACADAS